MWVEGNQHRPKKTCRSNKELLEIEGYLDEHDAKIALYEFLRENPSFTADLMLGVELFPFQHMAIKTMFDTDYTWVCGHVVCLSACTTTG